MIHATVFLTKLQYVQSFFYDFKRQIECHFVIFRKKEDSRAILFCKTREMTQALVSWINEDDELQHLRPTSLVGTNAPSSRQGNIILRTQFHVQNYSPAYVRREKKLIKSIFLLYILF